MENISPADGYQVFLYCSCRYTTLGFISIFHGISTPIEIIQIEHPEELNTLLDKSKKKLLVVCTHDDSLYFSARAAWFELCWEQNTLTKSIIRIRMFSEGGFSRRNGYYDFSLNDSIEQIRAHIIMLLNANLHTKRNVNHSISLTPREKELILCISEGLSVKGIARKMGVSERTIFVFRTSVIKKMGFRNRNHIHRLNFRCDEGFSGEDPIGLQC